MGVWQQIGEHLAAVGRGDEGAWSPLLIALTPELERLARRAPVGRLREDEDAQRDIVTKVIGKLHGHDHKVIKKFVGHPDPPPLRAWIRILVRSAAIDVMRGRPEFVRGNAVLDPRWLSLATLVTRDGAKMPESLVAKRREVERFMTELVADARKAVAEHQGEAARALATRWKIKELHARRLVKRIDHYPVVLAKVLEGHSMVEIGEQLELTRREVELVVGYIEELFHARGFAA